MGMRKTASSTKYEDTRIEPMNANQQYTEPVRVEPDADRAVIRRELPRRSPMGSINRGKSFAEFKMDVAVRKSNKVGPVVANASDLSSIQNYEKRQRFVIDPTNSTWMKRWTSG